MSKRLILIILSNVLSPILTRENSYNGKDVVLKIVLRIAHSTSQSAQRNEMVVITFGTISLQLMNEKNIYILARAFKVV
jgi:hypothetical protein